MPTLPIDIEHLLGGSVIESNRIEFKEGWNPKSIYRTICAFANDFDNIGGGYIVIGAQEVGGRAVRPVLGLDINQIDRIQREMVNFNKLIDPEYFPKVFIEDVDDKKVIVLWISGGSNRPYRVPDDVKAKEKHCNYYIRYNSSSIVPNRNQEIDLISLSNQIPFDDRANSNASLDDISMVLIRDFLVETNSKLAAHIELTKLSDILQQMDLVSGPPERLLPKNIALMLFSNKIEKFFPCSQVDIVIYPKGKEQDPSNFIEIAPIIGPVHMMIRATMEYLKTNIIKEKIIKLPDQAEAKKFFNYPYQALEEAVVNALYHRNYQEREPVEISIEPDNITIISYNGPDRSIKLEDLRKGKIKARRYRNRKLGDFLKELDLTEGRATGIPTIKKELKENGSPMPIFNTDDDRSYFLIEIPSHPDFIQELCVASINGQNNIIAKEDASPQEDVLSAIFNILLPKSIYILEQLLAGPLDKNEIFYRIKVSNQTYSKKRFLDPLIDLDLIEMTIKNKPRSRNQKYRITDEGKRILHSYKSR